MAEPELFGRQEHANRPPGKVSAPVSGLPHLTEQVNETASRLTVLEERMTNLRKKGQLMEQNLLEYERDARTDIKALTERVTELARKVQDVKETIDAMAAELGTAVKKHEFQVLERYMDLWQPLAFVTREEAKLLIQEALKRPALPQRAPPERVSSRTDESRNRD